MEDLPKPVTKAEYEVVASDSTDKDMKNRRGSGFLVDLLEQLRKKDFEAAGQDSLKEDKDSVEGKKSKRFRRGLSKLFRWIIAEPTPVSATAVEPSSSELPLEVNPRALEPQPDISATIKSTALPTVEDLSLKTPTIMPELTVDADSQSSLSKSLPGVESSIAQPRPELGLAVNNLTNAQENKPYDTIRTETRHIKETKSLRSVASSFVSPEFLARHREWKLRRTAKHLARQTKELEKQNKKFKATHEALIQTRNSFEAKEIILEPKQSTIEQFQSHINAPLQRQSIGNQTVNIPTAPQERAVMPANSLPPLEMKELATHEIAKIAPERVLEQVEVAADKNIPIETLYERRHEIKDAIGTSKQITNQHVQSGQFAAPLSQVLGSASFNRLNQALRDQRGSGSRINGVQLYRHAAKNGFWAALALLMVVSLVMVLR